MKIIDKFIDDKSFKNLNETMLGVEFPWYYNTFKVSTESSIEDNENFQFTHIFFSEKKIRTKEKEWDASYERKENFIFYPHEEVIRFISKYFFKRKGIGTNEKIVSSLKGLDVGCGIGKHVKFLIETGVDAYGVDLSNAAIKIAREWLSDDLQDAERLKIGSVLDLPFKANYFDLAVSHGVFDSMPFEVARNGVAQVANCLKPGGLFYIDLISGDDSRHYPEYDKEETVLTEHENGTIQSYFNFGKIEKLIENSFKIEEAYLIRKESVLSQDFESRYHLVLKK